MSQRKILKTHLERKAVIYVRQSSLIQVQTNTESKRRQYELVKYAQVLGWSAAHCETIDDDQAISGAQSYNRPGYQQLVSMVVMREVGIIIGLEVARLARNCLDWYHLLELAGLFDVLVADEDGVYDLSDFNDRFLLGMKGVFAEVELHQIRSRLQRTLLNKAQRGELRLYLPIGLDWDEDASKPRLAVDESIRYAIAQVFHLFRQLRSARGVLNYLRRVGVELPAQRQYRNLGRVIQWHRPSYNAIYSILTNPVYAGVYCFGKTRAQADPINHTAHIRNRPRDEWDAFLPNNHPGYIPLDEFEENQRLLSDHANDFPKRSGAARTGQALLQGLVFCQHCGHRMYVLYSSGRPYYTCSLANQQFGDPICNRACARRVDTLVEELFLTVVNAGTLQLTLAYDEKLRQEAHHTDHIQQQKLQRLEYETNLARRRYEAVDPENRLVARTLETEWNQKLEDLQAARQTYEAQQPSAYQAASTLAQMEQVVTHLRDYWSNNHLTAQDKKELLRCLIEQVFLENRGKVIRAQVRWFGGATSELDVPKYLFTSPHIYYRIRDLARTHTDQAIAAALNQEGRKTAKGNPWTVKRVMHFRRTNAIPSGFTSRCDELRIPNTGYISSVEAARQFGVSTNSIQNWFRWGILPGKQDSPQTPVWILWDEAVVDRLRGGATPDACMVSIRALCHTLDKNPHEVLAWAAAQGHAVYRLRRGKAMRFYILPAKPSSSPE